MGIWIGEHSQQFQLSNDPSSSSLLWDLLRHFIRDFAVVFLALTLTTIASFSAPIGVNKILKYLEADDQDTPIRCVWFWVLLLFFGPMTQAISKQWHRRVETDIQGRLQALLSQLVFEHSLRIRIPTGPSHAAFRPLQDVDNFTGKVYNLISADLDRIAEGVDFLSVVFQAPLQVVLCTILLRQILGWSVVVGIVTMLAFCPLAIRIGTKVHTLTARKMKVTDARAEILCEAVNVLRMIKLFGWERKMTQKIENKREQELYWLWEMKIVKIFSGLVSIIVPAITMLATFATYTLLLTQGLNASKIFPSMAIFSMLWEQLGNLAWRSAVVIESKVSLDRINDFLYNTEQLDQYKQPNEPDKYVRHTGHWEQYRDNSIGFRNTTFTWEVQDGCPSASSQAFRLQIEGELLFRPNCINLIIGPTGSGKTSMLMALLGEMHPTKSNFGSWFNLPRDSGVAYVAQESWILNATIRENILFGSPYDEHRYKKVIFQCALQQDIASFEAGDMTEIGESGRALSGGQKARITLARAIYSSAAILLVDDVLSGLDARTTSWVVNQCFRGDLVQGRTVLLVTHHMETTFPVASFVVSIHSDGDIETWETTPVCNPFDSFDSSEGDYFEACSELIEVGKCQAKSLVFDDGAFIEEKMEPQEIWCSLKFILSELGGSHPRLFIFVWISGMLATELVITLEAWFLGLWGSQYQDHLPSEVKLSFYISIFSVLLAAYIVTTTGTAFYYNHCSMDASRTIHTNLINSIFRAPLKWIVETPSALVMSRCIKDIGTVDGPMVQAMLYFSMQLIGMSVKLGAIIVFSPLFIFPSVFVAFVAFYLGRLYIKARMLLESASDARAPFLSHFSAALGGLVSIRAYGAQNAFRKESLKRINICNESSQKSAELNHWIGLRLNFLGALFTSGLALYLVYGPYYIGAANTGFSLNMSLNLCTCVISAIDILDELEGELQGLERIQNYTDIDREADCTESGKPPPSWPTSGDLRVENVSARYSKSGPEILHSISFHITSGQRIGVVGRTGSGKSTLMLALLRCIYTEGSILYDGIATGTINLDALRSSITVIPQTPELLGGTLRQNLDPFKQYDDLTLNCALWNSGLFSLQQVAGHARLSLDTMISRSGSNVSVGERQIIALARAMLRGSKVLILDEATAAIDYETDAIIQRTLKNQLGPDVTVITVAHRLHTIMDYDKIMVLDSGYLVEFDTPHKLLSKEKGVFRDLLNAFRERCIF